MDFKAGLETLNSQKKYLKYKSDLTGNDLANPERLRFRKGNDSSFRSKPLPGDGSYRHWQVEGPRRSESDDSKDDGKDFLSFGRFCPRTAVAEASLCFVSLDQKLHSELKNMYFRI